MEFKSMYDFIDYWARECKDFEREAQHELIFNNKAQNYLKLINFQTWVIKNIGQYNTLETIKKLFKMSDDAIRKLTKVDVYLPEDEDKFNEKCYGIDFKKIKSMYDFIDYWARECKDFEREAQHELIFNNRAQKYLKLIDFQQGIIKNIGQYNTLETIKKLFKLSDNDIKKRISLRIRFDVDKNITKVFDSS